MKAPAGSSSLAAQRGRTVRALARAWHRDGMPSALIAIGLRKRLPALAFRLAFQQAQKQQNEDATTAISRTIESID
jgi:hypothetical protein